MTQTTDTETVQAKPNIPWHPAVAILFAFATYFASSIGGQIVVLLAGLAHGLNVHQLDAWLKDSTAAQFINYLAVYALMALSIYFFARAHKVSVKVFGLVRPKIIHILDGVIAFPIYFIFLLLLTFVVSALVPSVNLQQEQQIGFNPSSAHGDLVLTFISLVILPPLVEEFVMRGFMFTSLLKRYSFAVSALVTSALFAVAHLQLGEGAPPLWVAALDTFILSLVLCYLRYRTGSLWAGITLHGLKNLAAFLAIFVFHGL